MPRIRGKLCNLVPIMLLSGVFILIILGAYVLQKSFNSGNGTVLRETLEHDQLKRTYLLYLPEGYDFSERLPLVINMHGYMSNARQQMYYGDFREIADREQFLLVHPQGTRHRGATHWNVGGKPAGSTVDDIGFINKLIDELAAGYNIDLSRVYATGISNGGAMSLNLAINLSNRIAAVASVVGPMTYPMKESEHEPKAMPMVLFFGTDDKVIPYEGDDTVLPVDETLKFWMERNGLDYNASIIL